MITWPSQPAVHNSGSVTTARTVWRHKNTFTLQSDVQAPLNRQIIKSSETIMYIVKLMNNFFDYFMGGAGQALADGFGNSVDNTDNMPRSGLEVAGLDVMQVLDFMRTLYNLTK